MGAWSRWNSRTGTEDKLQRNSLVRVGSEEDSGNIVSSNADYGAGTDSIENSETGADSLLNSEMVSGTEVSSGLNLSRC